jgi:hypothetical protein
MNNQFFHSSGDSPFLINLTNGPATPDSEEELCQVRPVLLRQDLVCPGPEGHPSDAATRHPEIAPPVSPAIRRLARIIRSLWRITRALVWISALAGSLALWGAVVWLAMAYLRN